MEPNGLDPTSSAALVLRVVEDIDESSEEQRDALLVELLTENIKLETPMAAVGGVYEGNDGIRLYFTDIEEAAPDFRTELDGVEEIDSKRVIAFMRTSESSRLKWCNAFSSVALVAQAALS